MLSPDARIARRVLAAWIPFRRARGAGAAAAAMSGATSFTAWKRSVVNEKVYTVSLLGIALISWLMVRWSDALASSGADRLLVLVAYLLDLGYANHPAALLPLPAAPLTVLARRAEVLPGGASPGDWGRGVRARVHRARHGAHPARSQRRAGLAPGETTTREWTIDLLNSVEPYAVLITNGDNDTFPLSSGTRAALPSAREDRRADPGRSLDPG
jgi:hypothetical protein